MTHEQNLKNFIGLVMFGSQQRIDPDALLVLRVSELPNPEPAVRSAAAALAAAEAEDAGPEEFA